MPRGHSLTAEGDKRETRCRDTVRREGDTAQTSRPAGSWAADIYDTRFNAKTQMNRVLIGIVKNSVHICASQIIYSLPRLFIL